MAATTRWKDNTITDIDQAIVELTDDVERDEKQTGIIWDNWHFTRMFENNQKIELNSKIIEYNYIKYSFNQTTVGEFLVEDRSVLREGFIIVYKSESGVNYIINQNTTAQRILRKILSYAGKNELEKHSFEFSNDFFIWLIYRVYNATYNIEMTVDNKELHLDSIKGFKGDTQDLQTKVSAEGETVINVISTLSFLLESNNLNQIKLELEYTGHSNISMVLQKGTVNLCLNEYDGSLEQEEEASRIAKLYLITYLEILPSLATEYYSDIENDLWNTEIYIKFMEDVAQTLTKQVDAKINAFRNEKYYKIFQ